MSPPETDLSPAGQAVLDALDEPSLVVGADGVVLAANRLYRDRLASSPRIVGRRCYELLHGPGGHWCGGDACLLSQSSAEGRRAAAVHPHLTPSGEKHVLVRVRPLGEERGRPCLFSFRVLAAVSARRGGEWLTGPSPALASMLEKVERAARASTPVLLRGEEGSGIDVVAGVLHDISPRSRGSLVLVDCLGSSDAEWARRLFGPAEDDGERARGGALAEASGGTLYLAHVEALPPSLQSRLLRRTESSLYGSQARGAVSSRLVCSTTARLEAAVEEERFRADLFLALSAFPIDVPPLRERREDIGPVAAAILRQLGATPGGGRLRPSALQALEAYAFPGNLAELASILEQARLRADGEDIRAEHLPAACRRPRDLILQFQGDVLPLAEAERRYLEWALAQCGGDRRRLAERLGLSSRTVSRRLERSTPAR